MLANASMLTVKQVQTRIAVGKPDAVLRLIHLGLLPATNISTGIRPTWRISEEDLAAFLEQRKARPPVKVDRRTRRPRTANVIEFF